MITILCGNTGEGKTSYLTYKLNEYSFNVDLLKKMQNEVTRLNSLGYGLEMPSTPVSSNYYFLAKKFGYRPRKSMFVDPYRLGMSNPYVETQFVYPYQVIGITEGQRYFNARKSKDYPDWQSRWFEFHRHDDLEILIDVQRYDLIDLNIRSLAQFLLFEGVTVTKNEHGTITDICWKYKFFKNCRDIEKFFSGDTSSNLYEQRSEHCSYNIFDCYDTKTAKCMYLDLRNRLPLKIKYNEPVNLNANDIKDYIDNYVGACPTNFYNSKSTKNKNEVVYE